MEQQFGGLSLQEIKLLEVLQQALPITEQPFAEIGRQIGLTEVRVLEMVQQLLESGMIRRMAGFFEPRKLGYTSTLCAVSVPQKEVDAVAAVINQFPEITHNYLRANACYNIWFTIIANGEDRLQEICRQIQQKIGYTVAMFPSKQFFKIKVQFALRQKSMDSPQKSIQTSTPRESYQLTEIDQRLIYQLGVGIQAVKRPFLELAERLQTEEGISLSEKQVLEHILCLQSAGYLRRLGIVIKHTEVGYTVNWMVVWQIPEERVQTVGEMMAKHAGVSHCYCRQQKEDWPYNLYTMIHAQDEKSARQMVAELAALANPIAYQALPTERELKKTGMRYFAIS